MDRLQSLIVVIKEHIVQLTVGHVVERIITLNHAWKLARDEYGNQSAITQSLKNQKSSWQSTLLREFNEASYLAVDTDNSTDDEILLSVRLAKPINVNGTIRTDAEHLPQRIAQDLFTAQELKKLLHKQG